MKVVISGSFRKHLEGILQLKKELENNGIQVIKPDKIKTIENRDNKEFVKFEGEKEKSQWELEASYLKAIEECDAHIIYNQDSYMGMSATMELGYRLATEVLKGKKVYLLERPSEEKWIEQLGNIDETEKQDIRNWCFLLRDMEREGILGVGKDCIYRAFGIKQIDDMER